MNLLRAFYRSDGLNLAGKTISRAAVRAVILDGDQILLVYSPVNHDYKFPGGGVEEDENHVEALSREIREECGLILEKVQGEFGLVWNTQSPARRASMYLSIFPTIISAVFNPVLWAKSWIDMSGSLVFARSGCPCSTPSREIGLY